VVDDVCVSQPMVSGNLLGSKPSVDDEELWVCYLEKALAIHCGRWDKDQGSMHTCMGVDDGLQKMRCTSTKQKTN
jgi:hypothetical protein